MKWKEVVMWRGLCIAGGGGIGCLSVQYKKEDGWWNKENQWNPYSVLGTYYLLCGGNKLRMRWGNLNSGIEKILMT